VATFTGIRTIKESLAEDAEDLAAVEERVKEPLISYESMVKKLKKDGQLYDLL
jgi:hypothetical protein